MAILIAMSALTLVTALAGALILGTTTETAIAVSYRDGIETFYAAESAVEFAVDELTGVDDWGAVLSGDLASAFIDGPPDGVREVGAVTLDLTAETADLDAIPDGVDPSYRLYAYGAFTDLISIGAVAPKHYVGIWVAELERDGLEEVSTMRVVGRAYGPTGARRAVAVSLTRAGKVLSWSDLRQ